MMRLIVAYIIVSFDLHIAFGLVEICRYYCIGSDWIIQSNIPILVAVATTSLIHPAGTAKHWREAVSKAEKVYITCHLTRRQVLVQSFVPNVMQIDLKWDLCLVWCCSGHPHQGGCRRTLCNSWMWVKLGEVHRGFFISKIKLCKGSPSRTRGGLRNPNLKSTGLEYE